MPTKETTKSVTEQDEEKNTQERPPSQSHAPSSRYPRVASLRLRTKDDAHLLERHAPHLGEEARRGRHPRDIDHDEIMNSVLSRGSV